MSFIIPSWQLRLRRRILALGAAIPLVVLAACAGPTDGLVPVSESDSSVYRLGPGDQIRIITFGEQQLTGEFRVDAAGDIALPLVGTVQAAGLTPRQLDGAVTQALKKSKLYRDPSVSVEVIAYRPIFILGEVARPGQYPYQPGMTVVTAVAVGGGFTYRAVKDRFSIVRNNRGQALEGLAVRETNVQPGDVVNVYERLF